MAGTKTVLKYEYRRRKIEHCDTNFGDDAYIHFGGDVEGDGDMYMGWDGTNLLLMPTTDDSGSFNIGDGTTDIDVKIFMGTTYCQFDVGNTKMYIFGTPAGENDRTLHIDLEPTGAEMRRGAISIDIWREESFAWAGSPDVCIKTSLDSDAANAAGGALRSIDTTARNRGTSISWVHGIHAGVRNDVGSTCPELIGLSTRVENYGTMATQMVGLDINMSCESDTGGGAKTCISVRNTDASAQTAVDQVLKVSHTSTNGYDYLVHFNSATGDTVSAGDLDGSDTNTIKCDARIAVLVNATPYYIPLYDTLG